ncbi:MAG: hypothetical protein SGPRY_008517, partial [Prymnesium sp.]
TVDLAGNQITEVPFELGNLTVKKLQSVVLTANPLRDARIRRFVEVCHRRDFGDCRPKKRRAMVTTTSRLCSLRWAAGVTKRMREADGGGGTSRIAV